MSDTATDALAELTKVTAQLNLVKALVESPIVKECNLRMMIKLLLEPRDTVDPSICIDAMTMQQLVDHYNGTKGELRDEERRIRIEHGLELSSLQATYIPLPGVYKTDDYTRLATILAGCKYMFQSRLEDPEDLYAGTSGGVRIDCGKVTIKLSIGKVSITGYDMHEMCTDFTSDAIWESVNNALQSSKLKVGMQRFVQEHIANLLGWNQIESNTLTKAC